MPANFIHLRNHTARSLSEGVIKLDELVAKCQELKMPAVGISDSNNMFWSINFSRTCMKAGVQPIISVQLNINFKQKFNYSNLKEKYPYAINWRVGDSIFVNANGSEELLSQIVLVAQNEKGYKNLMHLVSKGYIAGKEGEPAYITVEDLQEHNEGLIALTGGVRGFLGQALLCNQKDIANSALVNLKEIFKSKLYVELQRHGLKSEAFVEQAFVDLAVKHNIPLVATNNNFFMKKETYIAHDALLCVSSGRYVDEENRRHETDQHYFKTTEEMAELFSDIPEAIENTIKIAKRCHFYIQSSAPLLPHTEKGIDIDDEKKILETQAIAGVKERLKAQGTPEDQWQPYLDQTNFELEVINNMGFPGYFLIVADFIKWSKDNDIPVGPGRGSGAGSCVAWGLNITDLDPLRYGLLFERFLNPDRVSMPDFDIDFCQDGRELVIKYVQEKYGYDAVAQIITFGQFKSKLVIRDIARVKRMPYSLADRLAKMIPDKRPGVPMKLADALNASEELQEEYDNNEEVKDIIDTCMQLEGLYRHCGVHAAGVLIADRTITKLVPLFKDAKADLPVSQYDMDVVESTGLIKFDFLGLKTLSVIKHALMLVEKNHGVKINPNDILLDDEKTYKEIYQTGKTMGVFQVESAGMQKYLKELKPTVVEDIIAMVALYRPGPMENIPSFVARKHGLEKVVYPHPDLEEILDMTYGIIVYQEQVMQISRKLAGYTRGESDSLRKAMGKKIADLMAQHKIKFANGCEKNGVSQEVYAPLWEQMAKFAEYAFNKAHAACYAIISYQTAWIKANYPTEFYVGTLNYDLNNQDKIKMYLDDAKKMEIEVLPPDINHSFDIFTAENKAVRYGMVGLKGIGQGFAKNICNEREKNGKFKDFNDFIKRCALSCPTALNKKMLEGLTKAGAFDCFDTNRAKIFKNIAEILSFAHSISEDNNSLQSNLFFDIDEADAMQFRMKEFAPWTPSESIAAETEVLGFSLSSHNIEDYQKAFKGLGIISSDKIDSIKKSRNIKLAGVISRCEKRTSKKGSQYCVISIEDSAGSEDMLFFQDVESIFAKANKMASSMVVLEGELKVSDSGRIIFGKSVDLLKNLIDEYIPNITISIKSQEAANQVKKTLGQGEKGYTSVKIIMETGGKKLTLSLPEKYHITIEKKQQLQSLKDVEVK